MGGKLELKSEPGKGSTFTLYLPDKLVKISPDISYPISASSEVTKNVITILIAENEDSNFMLLQAILTSMGYKILRALNGKEAVDLCNENKIDLVLMDLKMPVMDGFTATSEILKINPDIRIIAQSAFAHPSDKEKAYKAGCIAYITKPFKKDQLLEVVGSYLK